MCVATQAYTARSESNRAERGLSGPGGALLLALGCLVLMALVWVVADLIPAAQAKDAWLLRDFTKLSGPRVDQVANVLIKALNPVLFILWGSIIIAVALNRQRPRLAVAAFVVMAMSPLTAEVLKPLLAHGHHSAEGITVAAGSWPSGHSTAAMSLVLSAVLVSAPRWRGVVAAAGALYAVGLGCSLLILQWHMPSDVVGGFLVASLWTSLAVAGLRLSERMRPSAGSSSQAAG